MSKEEVDSDEEFNKMERAEKRAKQQLKRNNFKLQKIKCCSTCDNCDQGCVEDPLECNEIDCHGYSFDLIDPLGICDRYKNKKWEEEG